MTAGVDCDPDVRKAIAAEINISVLSRRDESIRRVLSSASHAVMYELKDDIHQWRRCDVEGPLFLVERDINHSNNPGHVRHRLLIWNRKSPDDYVDDLVVGNRDIELTDKTIMYRNSKLVTVAIWFYKKEEAELIFNLMQKIASNDLGHSHAKSPAREMKSDVVRPKRPAKRQNKAKPNEISSTSNDPDKRNMRLKRGPKRENREQRSMLQDSIPADVRNHDDHPGRSEEIDYGGQRNKHDQQAKNGKSRVEVTERDKRNTSDAPRDAQNVKENPLQRFFPALKLSDGIAGAVLPENIRGKVVYEKDAVESMLPIRTHTRNSDAAPVELLDEAIVATLTSAPDKLPITISKAPNEGKEQEVAGKQEGLGLKSQSNSNEGEGDRVQNGNVHIDARGSNRSRCVSTSTDVKRERTQLSERATQEVNKSDGLGNENNIDGVNSLIDLSNSDKRRNPNGSSLAKSESTVLVDIPSAQNTVSVGRLEDKQSGSATLPTVNCAATSVDEIDTKMSSETKDHNVSSSQGIATHDRDGKKEAQRPSRTEMQFPPVGAMGFEVNGVAGGGGNNPIIEPGSASNFSGMHPHVAMMMHHQRQHMMMQHMMQQQQQQHQEQQRQIQMQMCGFGTTGTLAPGLSAGVPNGMGAIPVSGIGPVPLLSGLMGSGVLGHGSNVPGFNDLDGTGAEVKDWPMATNLEIGDTSVNRVDNNVDSKKNGKDSQRFRKQNVPSGITEGNHDGDGERIDPNIIATGVSKVQRKGKLGMPNDSQLDRTSFRAVLQRMLTDRQLFDEVYQHYIDSQQL